MDDPDRKEFEANSFRYFGNRPRFPVASPLSGGTATARVVENPRGGKPRSRDFAVSRSRNGRLRHEIDSGPRDEVAPYIPPSG
ncbi:hypothetical protein GCM10027160_10440 [Streptomyces calidiresistens]